MKLHSNNKDNISDILYWSGVWITLVLFVLDAFGQIPSSPVPSAAVSQPRIVSVDGPTAGVHAFVLHPLSQLR